MSIQLSKCQSNCQNGNQIFTMSIKLSKCQSHCRNVNRSVKCHIIKWHVLSKCVCVNLAHRFCIDFQFFLIFMVFLSLADASFCFWARWSFLPPGPPSLGCPWRGDPKWPWEDVCWWPFLANHPWECAWVFLSVWRRCGGDGDEGSGDQAVARLWLYYLHASLQCWEGILMRAKFVDWKVKVFN